MRAHPEIARRLAPWLLLLLLGATGCAKSNTVVLVTVEDANGRLTNNIIQLRVTVVVGDALSRFVVPKVAAAPLTFPTTFTVEMDRSHSGALVVTVAAQTASASTAAEASTSLPALSVGGTNRITVRLGTAPTDGGVDATTDASTDASADVSTDASSDGPTDGARDGSAAEGGTPSDARSDGPSDPVPDAAGPDGVTGSGGMAGSGGAPGTGGDPGVGGNTGAGGDTGVGGDPGTGGAGVDVDAGDDADPDAVVD